MSSVVDALRILDLNLTERRVLEYLLMNEWSGVADIVDGTGLHQPNVSVAKRSLLERDFVVVEVLEGRGRPEALNVCRESLLSAAEEAFEALREVVSHE